MSPETNPHSPADKTVEFPSPARPERERQAPLRLRRRWKSWQAGLIAGVLLLVLVSGGLLWRYFASYESTDDAQVDVHLYPVSARVSGYVISVNVNDNQPVEKGAVLVEVDPRDYQVAVDKARADLANAEATAQSLDIAVPIASVDTSSQLKFSASDVENAHAGIAVAERQLAAAHAQWEQAAANDVKTQDDLKRYKLLLDRDEVSAQIYDQALAAAKASTAGVTAARANEDAAQQSVKQAKSRLSEAEANHRVAETAPEQVASTRARALSAAADVQEKRAALNQAELNLQYTRIVAPVGGEVNKNVVAGMNVQPGQGLLNIIPLDDVWITANFKEAQLKQLRPGERVEISVDSNGRSYKGHIDSIGGATGPVFSLLPPENATGNYVKIVQRIPVKIVLDPGENRDHQLRPGMNVEPKVYLR
jgi:membrane fusion protein (multidrug efflux system)